MEAPTNPLLGRQAEIACRLSSAAQLNSELRDPREKAEIAAGRSPVHAASGLPAASKPGGGGPGWTDSPGLAMTLALALGRPGDSGSKVTTA